MTLHSQSSGVTEYYWDEVNRLRVVNSEKLMHHYFYDATGERVLKATTSQEDVYENGQAVLSQVYLNNFTTYPSGFIVVEPDGRYTKHYYAGTQRVASQTGDVYASSIFGRPENNGGSTAFNPAEHKQQLLRDMLQYAAKTGQELPKFKESKEGDSSTTAQDHRAKLISELYFYHPDHLGTSTYVTDGQGFAHQFFLNLPFGETMVEQHSFSSDFDNRYKFNGKELDVETGLYYYGARYYNPQLSIWLSVDPLAEKFPNWNPYNYVMQNPINLIDPTGMEPTPYPINKLGSVDYYKWRHDDFVKQNPGKKAPSYYLEYGDKYIKRFTNETNKFLSNKGKEWLVNARRNLQVAIEDKLKTDPMIESRNEGKDFMEFAFDSHVKAYWDAALKELNTVDLVAIVLTPNFEDLKSEDN